jgi:hypothetical protein
VGVRAADERRVQHARQLEVFEEGAVADEQPGVLEPLDPFAEEPLCRHAGILRMTWIASRVARAQTLDLTRYEKSAQRRRPGKLYQEDRPTVGLRSGLFRTAYLLARGQSVEAGPLGGANGVPS